MISKFIKNKLPIFGIVVIFIIGFNYISFNYFIKSFIFLEQQENKKTLASLISYMDAKFNSMKITANDYSYWDDTYKFIEDGNQEYIYNNFRDTIPTLENVKLDFMFFVNLNNKIIYSKLSSKLSSNIDNKDDFTKNILASIKNDTKSTLVEYKNNYYYIVKSNILKSDLKGDPNGFLYVGKILNLKEFNEDYKTDIKTMEKSDLKSDFILKSKILNEIEITFNYKNDFLENIISFKNDEKTLATLQFDYYREMYKQSKKQIILFNVTISIFSLLLFFIFYLYLYHHQKLNIKLEEKIKDEIKKQKAQEEILISQSRSAGIGEMINNIAHQWRQPLSNLSLTIQNIGFTYGSGDLTQETLDESINKSKKIINSMSNTIDTFRDFFEPNKNKNLFKIEHSINNTIEILSSALRFYNIKLTKEIIDDIETYNYENEFCQVLLNIITNAKDALVSEKIKDPKINIKLYKMQNKLIVEIKDNAKGIDEKIINKIFEPYFTTKGKGEGTGIGLYMSKLIIEKNMHGKLEVKNDTEGAVFIITLNITKEEI